MARSETRRRGLQRRDDLREQTGDAAMLNRMAQPVRPTQPGGTLQASGYRNQVQQPRIMFAERANMLNQQEQARRQQERDLFDRKMQQQRLGLAKQGLSLQQQNTAFNQSMGVANYNRNLYNDQTRRTTATAKGQATANGLGFKGTQAALSDARKGLDQVNSRLKFLQSLDPESLGDRDRQLHDAEVAKLQGRQRMYERKINESMERMDNPQTGNPPIQQPTAAPSGGLSGNRPPGNSLPAPMPIPFQAPQPLQLSPIPDLASRAVDRTMQVNGIKTKHGMRLGSNNPKTIVERTKHGARVVANPEYQKPQAASPQSRGTGGFNPGMQLLTPDVMKQKDAFTYQDGLASFDDGIVFQDDPGAGVDVSAQENELLRSALNSPDSDADRQQVLAEITKMIGAGKLSPGMAFDMLPEDLKQQFLSTHKQAMRGTGEATPEQARAMQQSLGVAPPRNTGLPWFASVGDRISGNSPEITSQMARNALAVSGAGRERANRAMSDLGGIAAFNDNPAQQKAFALWLSELVNDQAYHNNAVR